jgi:hypothetical protein
MEDTRCYAGARCERMEKSSDRLLRRKFGRPSICPISSEIPRIKCLRKSEELFLQEDGPTRLIVGEAPKPQRAHAE